MKFPFRGLQSLIGLACQMLRPQMFTLASAGLVAGSSTALSQSLVRGRGRAGPPAWLL